MKISLDMTCLRYLMNKKPFFIKKKERKKERAKERERKKEMSLPH